MAAEWRPSTWGQEITLEYGKAYRSHATSAGRYRVFGSNGPIGWTDEPLAPGPGVILGRKGAYRGVEFSRDPFFVIDTAYYVAPKTELDMRWIYYAIKHHKLGEIDDGSPIPSTTRAAVYIRELLVPPTSEQRAIAHVLGTLDDKIELNRRMNETLEVIAREIFKSWFVDFDPVRAKAEGRDPGLPRRIADLFPSRLQNSPLGDIPTGWSVEPLSLHIEAMKGLSYKGSGLTEEGIPLHNLNSVYEGGGYKYEGIKHYNGEYKDRHIVQPGDIIVTNTEQGHDLLLIGYPGIVPRRFGEWGLFSHHLFRVRCRPTSPVKRFFLYYMLMTPYVRDQITGHTNGTTVNMLASSGLEMPLIVVPAERIVAAFEATVGPIWERIEQTHEENPALEATRDTLLPKLLSGELRITNVEAFLRRVQ